MAEEKNSRDLSPVASVPFCELLGCLAGSASVGIYSVFFNTFILIYYTNVVHINPGLAASIIAVSRIFDGLSDLVMGRVVDNTRSKYGKSRPWYLRMIIPAILCAIFAFWQPVGLDGTLQIIYIFLTYNLAVTVCNTAMAVPNQSYVSYATMNAKARSFLGGMHMLGANVLVPLVVTSNFLKISEIFGGGNAYTHAGFLKTLLIFLALYAVLSMICFVVIRERVHDINGFEDSAQKKKSVKKMVKSLFTNKYWLICTGITSLTYVLLGSTSGTMVYYTQYVAGNLELQTSITRIYTLTMLAALIMTLVFVIGRLGKRNTILIGTVMAVIGYSFPLFMNSPAALHIGGAFRGIGFGISSVPVGSILQDALTYGLWKDGFSAVGMGNAAGSFVNKLGSAFGTAALGWVLQWGGFVSTATVQSAKAQDVITFMYAAFPAILCAGMLVLAINYDLDGEKYTRIEQDIKSGNFGNKRK